MPPTNATGSHFDGSFIRDGGVEERGVTAPVGGDNSGGPGSVTEPPSLVAEPVIGL